MMTALTWILIVSPCHAEEPTVPPSTPPATEVKAPTADGGITPPTPATAAPVETAPPPAQDPPERPALPPRPPSPEEIRTACKARLAMQQKADYDLVQSYYAGLRKRNSVVTAKAKAKASAAEGRLETALTQCQIEHGIDPELAAPKKRDAP